MRAPTEQRPERSTTRIGAGDPLASRFSTSLRLLFRAQRGETGAVESLFARVLPGLTRWARGRLPGWARARMDTDDLVQEAFAGVFRRLGSIEPRRKRALRAYLQQAIRNRIRDEVRRAGRVEVSPIEGLEKVEAGTSPLEGAIAAQEVELYRAGVKHLSKDDQMLVVGRLELDYNYDQLALATGRPSADAARMAVKRALLRLADKVEVAQG